MRGKMTKKSTISIKVKIETLFPPEINDYSTCHYLHQKKPSQFPF